jgi:hypothetical protein
VSTWARINGCRAGPIGQSVSARGRKGLGPRDVVYEVGPEAGLVSPCSILFFSFFFLFFSFPNSNFISN